MPNLIYKSKTSFYHYAYKLSLEPDVGITSKDTKVCTSPSLSLYIGRVAKMEQRIYLSWKVFWQAFAVDICLFSALEQIIISLVQHHCVLQPQGEEIPEDDIPRRKLSDHPQKSGLFLWLELSRHLKEKFARS